MDLSLDPLRRLRPAQSDNFPDVDAPSPNSVRPSGWDADDIRSTWLHNLAG